jgi:hypothetical protein
MRNGLVVLAVTWLALGACDSRRNSDATSQLDLGATSLAMLLKRIMAMIRWDI